MEGIQITVDGCPTRIIKLLPSSDPLSDFRNEGFTAVVNVLVGDSPLSCDVRIPAKRYSREELSRVVQREIHKRLCHMSEVIHAEEESREKYQELKALAEDLSRELGIG